MVSDSHLKEVIDEECDEWPFRFAPIGKPYEVLGDLWIVDNDLLLVLCERRSQFLGVRTTTSATASAPETAREAPVK